MAERKSRNKGGSLMENLLRSNRCNAVIAGEIGGIEREKMRDAAREHQI